MRRYRPIALALGGPSLGVFAALVVSILGGLNGVVPEHDAPAVLRILMQLLLLNSLVLAWTAVLRRDPS